MARALERFVLVMIISISFAGLVMPSARIKVIKLTITNPTNEMRIAENIVLSVADLKRIAADFKAGDAIVTTSDATTLEEDTNTLQTIELPSQADDLDDDRKYDEFVFQIDLQPKQTRIVTIAFGDSMTIARLRSEYRPRTNAKFAMKFEGLGWESDINAWRIYFDKRNAIDLFGKRRPGLYLELFGKPEYNYHEESPFGRDIYKIGEALGIGAVGALVDGKVAKVADVSERLWRIIATGPVRAIVELEYKGWKVGGRSVDLTSRMTTWAGERGFEHRVTAKNADGLTIVTGLPRKPGLSQLSSADLSSSVRVVGHWGHHVLMTGATATASLPDQNLGLVLLLPSDADTTSTVITGNPDNVLAIVSLKDGSARWYVSAAWDQEGSERMLVTAETATGKNNNGTLVYPSTALTTREQFVAHVNQIAARLTNPAKVSFLTQVAAAQSAPTDTIAPAIGKTYKHAIDLLRQSTERTARKWEPIVSASKSEDIGFREGAKGFFTEGNQQTGEWKEQKGYFWTGGFWVSRLWHLYRQTGDAQYRRWAELWHARLLGEEETQNHDTGFLNFYTSALAYDITRDQKYRESGLRAASA